MIFDDGDHRWGPNETFGYPLHGGIGEIFRKIAQLFSVGITYGKTVVWIDLDEKTIGFADGSCVSYDHLINTMPLDCFVKILKKKPEQVMNASRELIHNKALIVGIGLDGATDSKKSWVYYPEQLNPCYRVTFLSNYSPHMAPVGDGTYSLLGEISYPSGTVIDIDSETEKTIAGFQTVQLMNKDEDMNIRSVFTREVEYSYPVPSLNRDRSVNLIQHFLVRHQVYSRGRFGAWKYETGNMDHSFMQGYEVVDRVLHGEREAVFNS